MSSSAVGRRIFAAIIVAFILFFAYERFSRDSRTLGAVALPPTPFLASRFSGQDLTTEAIRSESSVLSRVHVRSDADRSAAQKVGRIVEDYGPFVLIAKSKELQAKSFGLEEQLVETTVNLPGASFDPIRDAPTGSLRLGPAATAGEKGYYVVQFGGTPTDTWMKSIRDAGVEVIQYVPHQAFFVYGEQDAIARIANHSRVRWIGKYQAEQKLSRNLRDQIDSARGASAPRRGIAPLTMTRQGASLFDVAVFARADVDAVAAELQKSYGLGAVRITRLQHNFFNIVRIELNLDDVAKVAAIDDVVGIGAVGPSRNEDARSNHILAGNYINSTTLSATEYDPFTQFGTDGTNITVSVVDDGVGIPGEGGFYIHSLNAANAALRGAPSGAVGHGHFNATIIAGSALPSPPLDPGFYNYGIGVAPRANIVSIPRNRIGYTGDDVTVYNDSVTTPGPNGAHAMISNNSWGNGTNGNHYEFIEEGKFDGIVRDASLGPGVDPIVLIFSAGNEGTNGLTRPKVAKNVISVGNSENLRSEMAGSLANSMDDLADDSSRGPAADGRIKPDIVAPGTAITGGRSGMNTLSGNLDAFHRWSFGTSHSAAHISGVAALFSSWYGSSSGFGVRPTPSLVKAALINSAVDLNGQNSSAPVPNGSEGWGRPNLKSMFRTGVNMKYVNEEVALQETGNGSEFNGSVADASKPVRITLAWTDPPGTADPALVNNLDLTVTVGGVVYKGNVFSNGVSVTGGNSDTRNNVENVFLPAGIPAGTNLSVSVTATALNGDGILNNGDATDQSFSLVIYNYSTQVSPGFFQLSGRLTSPSGRGIGYVTVRLTDSQGIVREVRSNPLGYFRFTNIPGGQSYTVNASAKRYAFTQQVIAVSGNFSNLNFVSNSNAP